MCHYNFSIHCQQLPKPYGFLDATCKEGTLGRLINHARKPHANITFLMAISKGQPRVGAISLRTIKKGEQLLWDYEPKREKNIPWTMVPMSE